MFISQNPHHLEALIQLAMVFARTGSIDKADELIRRCICNIECCLMNAFEPWNQYAPGYTQSNRSSSSTQTTSSSHYNLQYARMDACCEQNRIFFTALFRHAQITLMLGCPIVSLNIVLVLLSLDPMRDPLFLLLLLDNLIVQTGDLDLFERWYCADCASATRGFVLGLPYEFLTSAKQTTSDVDASSDKSVTSSEVVSTSFDGRIFSTVQDLPNWNYSYSLLQFLKNGSCPQSDAALVEAVMKFPFMLKPLISQAGAVVESGKWKKVLDHRLFTDIDM